MSTPPKQTNGIPPFNGESSFLYDSLICDAFDVDGPGVRAVISRTRDIIGDELYTLSRTLIARGATDQTRKIARENVIRSEIKAQFRPYMRESFLRMLPGTCVKDIEKAYRSHVDKCDLARAESLRLAAPLDDERPGGKKKPPAVFVQLIDFRRFLEFVRSEYDDDVTTRRRPTAVVASAEEAPSTPCVEGGVEGVPVQRGTAPDPRGNNRDSSSQCQQQNSSKNQQPDSRALPSYKKYRKQGGKREREF
eukprot:PhM_4_TR15352/c0_g1_i1/m.13860